MRASHRPYHLYPLLAVVFAVITVVGVGHRLKHAIQGDLPAPSTA